MTLLATTRATWSGSSERGPVEPLNGDAWAWSSDASGALLFVVVDGRRTDLAQAACRAAQAQFAKPATSQRLAEVARVLADAIRSPARPSAAALLVTPQQSAVAFVGLPRQPFRDDDVLLHIGERDARGDLAMPAVNRHEHDAEIEIVPLVLGPGTRLLLCSNGIHDALSDGAIAEMLDIETSAEAAALALVDEAIRAGSSDNLTAVVVDLR